ncbi:MAG: ArsA family ATPase [Candidatus Methanomethylophilaceae archaeon]
MRLIIYTGKGGVGKTSTSAATAYRLSELGYRTILMSTDSAHSIGDSLDMELGNDIVNVRENLDVLEVDVIHEMKYNWTEVQEYISALMLSQGMGEISADEMAIFPGMEMIAALFYVNRFEKEGKYDVIVMDTAPTGETLRLLSFPDITNWYIDKVFGVVKRFIGLARATVGKMMDVPLPSKEVLDSLEILKNNMEEVRVLMEDPRRTTVRLVLNPERMVIRETMRAYTYLSLFNKNVEALIVNRVLPAEVGEAGYFKGKMDEQAEYMEMIHNAFDPMEIKTCTYMPTELRGVEMLRNMAIEIYGDEDPCMVYAGESPMSMVTENGEDQIRLKMPFVDGSDVDLFRLDANSIMVQTGSQKRTIHLPDSLVESEIIGAGFKDDKLIIRFRRD